MIRLIVLALLSIQVSDTFSSARELGEPNFSNEDFIKRFTASYGILSEREPPLNDIEIIMLKKMAPLIRIDKEQAQNFLQSMTTSEQKHSASFNYLLGNIYFENQEFLLAEEQYKIAIESFPDFQRAWTNLGVLKLRSGDTQSALIAFLKAVELGDSKGQTFGMLGYCHYAEGNYISAEVAYNRAILAEPDSLDWLEGKAQTYLKAERYVEAIRAQDELIARKPRNAQYWLAQTNAYLRTNDHERAARNLEIVHSLGATDFQSLSLLGGLYAKLKMFAPASEAYLAAAEYARPTDLAFLVEATNILVVNQQLEAAKKLFAKIDPSISTFSESELTEYHIAAAELSYHDGRIDEAIIHLSKAEKTDPLNGRVLTRLAQLHSETGNRDKAFLLLDRAELDPEYEYNSILTRIKLLVEQKRFSESQAYVARALRLNANETTRALYEQVQQAARSVTE